jgi:hypothetical protein
MSLYKILVRPVASYVYESGHLSKHTRALGLFERRNLWSIFGFVQVKGHWKRKWNSEIHKLYDDPDRAKYIVAYLLKEGIVEPKKLPLLGNSCVSTQQYQSHR